MAGKPQKNLAYSVLLDFYGPALTEKQRAILTEYYDEDLSLAEIAENFGITRQGVRDAIKHGEAALDELEAQLGNARRHAQMQEDLARLHQLVMEIRCCNSGLFNPVPAHPHGYRRNAEDHRASRRAGGTRWRLSL